MQGDIGGWIDAKYGAGSGWMDTFISVSCQLLHKSLK